MSTEKIGGSGCSSTQYCNWDGAIPSMSLNMPTLKTVFANPMSVTAPVHLIHAGKIPVHAVMHMVPMTGVCVTKSIDYMLEEGVWLAA